MFTLADLNNSKLTLTKNLVSDQTFTNLTFRLNSSGAVFTSDGVGTTTATSTLAVTHMGGFNDQKITSVMKFITPTLAGGEHIGVMARFQSIEDTASSTYYLARVQAGVARLSKVVGGTFTNLSSSAFALAQNTSVTIVLSVVGTALTASFDAGGSPTTVNLSATDSAITGGGLMGFRTTSCTGFCSSFTVEQL